MPSLASLSPEHAPSRSTFRELALSAAWHGGVPTHLTTTDGVTVRVVHRGVWSHGFGPDFTGAILELDGREVLFGDVELHLDADDWSRHGHHTDARYNQVVLHVVLKPGSLPARREDGLVVPVAVVDLPDDLLFTLDRALPEIWDQIGSTVCAEDLAAREPQRIRAALLHLGDQRLHERAAWFGGELEATSAPRLLVRGLFDAFGYSMNRAPMQRLFDLLDDSGVLDTWLLDPAAFTADHTQALLFGLGGFLPLSPGDAHLAGIAPSTVSRIEQIWSQRYGHLATLSIPATDWVRARTRPANHPAARLSTLATMLNACGANPLPVVLHAVRDGRDLRMVLRDLCLQDGGPGLGIPRATAISASVVLPLLLACAQREHDPELEDAAWRAWTDLPRSEWSRSALRARQQAAGEAPLGKIGERAIQGLLQLDRQLCGPRRCFECPIAAEVLSDRRRQRLCSPGDQEMSSVLPT